MLKFAPYFAISKQGNFRQCLQINRAPSSIMRWHENHTLHVSSGQTQFLRLPSSNSIVIEFEQIQDVSPLIRLLSAGCQPSDPSSAFRMSALWSVFCVQDVSPLIRLLLSKYFCRAVENLNRSVRCPNMKWRKFQMPKTNRQPFQKLPSKLIGRRPIHATPI